MVEVMGEVHKLGDYLAVGIGKKKVIKKKQKRRHISPFKECCSIQTGFNANSAKSTKRLVNRGSVGERKTDTCTHTYT